MGCLVFLIGLVTPRLVLFFIWLLTDWFSRAYGTPLRPLPGFTVMPYTTLTYMGAKLNRGAVNGIWLVIVVIAVLVDLGFIGGTGAHGARRRL